MVKQRMKDGAFGVLLCLMVLAGWFVYSLSSKIDFIEQRVNLITSALVQVGVLKVNDGNQKPQAQAPMPEAKPQETPAPKENKK